MYDTNSPSTCSHSDAVAAGRVTKTERDIEVCRQAASMSFFYEFLTPGIRQTSSGLRPGPLITFEKSRGDYYDG